MNSNQFNTSKVRDMMQAIKSRFRLSPQKELLIPAAYVAGAFILGLIGGASILHTLNPSQLAELRQYLDSILSNMGALAQNGQFPVIKTWGDSLRGQLYALVIMWLMGLTVVGAPLVILLTGARGFILGFTIGFLVQEKAGQGLMLALVAVLPQNLCYVPGLLVAGTLALYFSLSLFRPSRETTVFTGILTYTLLFVACAILILLGSWIEAYLVPGIIRLTMLIG
ncbi:MAG: stage II sporulation protein M [Thermacetogeniaceae bacterium]